MIWCPRAHRALGLSARVRCVLPDVERNGVVAQCRIGKQDISECLVANGWAKAGACGPYTEAGRKAQVEKRCVYGPAPRASK